MIALEDCQSYLQEICRRYERWSVENALTEAISDRQATFSFEQMVQTEEKDAEGQLKKIPPLPIFTAIQNYIESEHILLVGSPGVGKSTALWCCLVQLVETEREKPEPRIPVLISLKRYNNHFSCPEDPSGILALIKDTLEPDLWLEVSDIKKLLFKDKRLILLLDGLNEMSAGEKRTELEEFRKKCDRSKVPLICTTRELGGGDLGIKRRLEIQPLISEEVARFLQDCIPDRKQKVSQLLNRDNRPLSRTPFVLWMLYDLFQKQGTKVETLAEAFRQFFQSFKKYKEDAPVSEDRRQEWNRWLEHLAFTMLNHPDPTDPGLVISQEQAEKSLIEKFGDLYGASSRIEELLKYHLLEEISEKEISFHHQLIQEYYAAECLLTRLPDLLKKQRGQQYTPFQVNYLNYVKWTEAIALMLGLLELGNQTERLIELALDTDLKLGARLSGEVQPSLQRAAVDVILNKKFTPTLTVWLLEQSRSLNALPYLFDVLSDGYSDTRWRAARALGDFSDPLVLTNLVEALKDPDSSVRHKAAESLGKLGNVDVVPYLCPLLDDKDWLVRSFVVDIIGKLEAAGSVECLKHGLEHDDSSIRNKAAEYLGKLAPQLAISLLSEKFVSGNTDTKRDVTNLLHETKTPKAIPVLIQALSDNDWIVRSNAASQIGLLGIWLDKNLLEEALTELIHILQTDPEISVRSSAAISLGVIGDSQAVSALIEALSQEDPVVRASVINSLGRLRDPAAIHPLIQSLKDDDYVCEAAIKALRALNAVEALPKIRKLVQSKVINIRREALFTLGFVGDSKDIPSLYKALQKNEPFPIRLCAAYSLSLLNNRKGVAVLEDSLETGNKEARELALDGLKNFKGKVGLSSILSRAFKDEEFSIHKDAIDFLNSFREYPEVAKQLKNALDSSNEDICRNAMDAAKILGNAEDLPNLRHLAETIIVVERPLEAIAAIQSRCGFYNYEIAQLSLQHQSNVGIAFQKQLSQGLTNVTNININSGANVGGVNVDSTVHGSQIGANYNYINDESFKQEIAELRLLVNQLQQTRQPTTEAEAIQVIDAEFHEIQRTNPNRWQAIQKQLKLLKRQLLNPERHLAASKAAISEVAKHYLEDSIIAKALITYVDTMSANPDQGE